MRHLASLNISGPHLERAERIALEERLAPVPADAYGILGVQVRLKTDSPGIREFFAHAYRWFAPGKVGRPSDLAAIFSPDIAGGPFAMADSEWLDLAASTSPENRAFLFLLESIMDRIDGSILIHAGAVSHTGRGVILAGSAFAGKSTLVLEMLERGCGFLSDDAAPVDRQTGMILPFPRAIGVRKIRNIQTLPPERLSGQGVHELPHRWLVDPSSLGARLPAEPCRPNFLFYLDPWAPAPDAGTGFRTFDVALAEENPGVLEELRAITPEPLERLEGLPFPSVRVVIARRSPAAGGLAALWRRRRREILYVEEARAEAERVAGRAVIAPCRLTEILLPVVRDILNRGDTGLLLAAHHGRLTSLAVELGALLKNVKCYKVSSGGSPEIAASIAEILEAENSPC